MVLLQRKGLFIVAIVGALAVLGTIFFVSNRFDPFFSVELNTVTHSPLGIIGGYILPASCPSYEHSPGECASSYAQSSYGGGGGGTTPTPGGSSNPYVNCSPSTVRAGNSVTCTWQCDVAHGDVSSSGIGFPTGGAASGTSIPITPSQVDNSYGVRCSPSNRQMLVNVKMLNPALSIIANPTRIHPGASAAIQWGATGVRSCSVTGTGVVSHLMAGSADTGALTQQSVYTLSCQSDVGPLSATATVLITPSVCEIGVPGCE